MLYLDGNMVGEDRVEQTGPFVFSADRTCDIGYQAGSPSSTDYRPTGNRLSEEVNWVEIDLGKDAVSLGHLITPENRLRVASQADRTIDPPLQFAPR